MSAFNDRSIILSSRSSMRFFLKRMGNHFVYRLPSLQKDILPGPFEPPAKSRPSRKITALSYSWTTCNGKKKKNYITTIIIHQSPYAHTYNSKKDVCRNLTRADLRLLEVIPYKYRKRTSALLAFLRWWCYCYCQFIFLPLFWSFLWSTLLVSYIELRRNKSGI